MKKIALIFLILIAGCAPKPSVENLGIFAANKDMSIAGLDGFSAIPVNANTILWTFGDTIIGGWNSPVSVDTTFEKSGYLKSMLSNSAAITGIPDDSNITNLKFNFHMANGAVKEFMEPGPGMGNKRARIWPLDGIFINGELYLYYVKVWISNQGAKPASFDIAAIGLARIKLELSGEKISRITVLSSREFVLKNTLSLGDAVLKRDGFIYVAGRKKNKDGFSSAIITRVNPEDMERIERYEYLAGDGTWSRDKSKAGLFGSMISGEFSLSYHEESGAYLLIYMSLDGGMKMIKFASFEFLGAAQAREIYRPERLPEIKSRPFMFYYSGKEIFQTRGNIYAIYINPAIYQPMLVRIPNRLVTEAP